MNVMDLLRQRGFIKQVVYEDELYKKLETESVPFYIGFDPTADSLHVGHYLVMMAMGWMQKAGHKPIVLIGGGTGMVGDPSGRTDMRMLMTPEIVAQNCEKFKVQMSKFFSFEGENAAIMVNNADWLLNLNYIDFLREIGVHFSVNRMLTAECFKNRMEKGLSFFEFNYMLMQGYDFLVLNKKYNCILECGGDDQWSNMLAGVDLIRRKEQKDAFAMTFSLLTTSQGTKMGKTAKGAVWLDRNKTTPYEFYQYWRNIDDNDVEKCLKLLTFVDIEEINAIVPKLDEYAGENKPSESYEKRINKAKMRLAFEVTSIVHSKEDAQQAEEQALAAFSGAGDNIPTATVSKDVTKIVDLLVATKLAPSKGEAKRLILGGGIIVDDTKILSIDAEIEADKIASGIVLHKGKKNHLKIIFE